MISRTISRTVLRFVRTIIALLAGMALLAGCATSGTAGGSGTSSADGASVDGLGVALPDYIMPGIVFQRDKPIHVRGTVSVDGGGAGGSSAAVPLTVRFVHGDKRYETTKQVKAGAAFDIAVNDVPTRKDAYTLAFLINDQVVRTVRDVYVGDVFVAAGQSNMELNHIDYYGTDALKNVNIAGAFPASDLPKTVDDSGIHFLAVDRKLGGDTLPLRSVSKTAWATATGSNTQYLGYLPQLFAAQLRAKHPNVPIGIIQIAWGGTAIALHMKGGSIYANHVKPLTGYRVAGVLWYQGEDDAITEATALRYESRFAALINQYRTVFGESDLPFLYVQLARYASGDHRYTPIVRQAQLDVLSSAAVNTTKHLAMTVSIDTDKGTSKVIHPLGKDILAARMAAQWLAMTEAGGASGSSGSGGSSGTDESSGSAGSDSSAGTGASAVPSGPLARGASAVKGDASTVAVTFAAGTANGLRAMTPNYTTKATASNLAVASTAPLQGFEVAGADGVFHAADAAVQGSTVIVHSDAVATVVQVRYLWGLAPNSSSMLYDAAGLPASPFLLGVGKE